jgi:hypothetical protein
LEARLPVLVNHFILSVRQRLLLMLQKPTFGCSKKSVATGHLRRFERALVTSAVTLKAAILLGRNI